MMMWKRFLALVLALALVSASAASVAARWAWNRLNAPYQGYPAGETIITIEAGRSGAQIIRSLSEAGILQSPTLCRLFLRFGSRGEPLKAGEYAFREPLSAIEVLEMLQQGQVLTHRVTVLEGLTLEETATTLAGAGFGRLEVFLNEMSSPRLIADLDPEATDLEGYLFPDTYAFASGTSESRIIETLVATARSKIEDKIQPLLPQDTSRTLREVVTLASIVEKEALIDSERPIIAGVYANRLARGIGLFADPTVIFAMKKAGTWDGNIRRSDLEIDSPYNTYRYSGLPPGPIASPGLASLLASAQPAEVPYLYFVSRNDGTHVFSKTLAEHNRNVYTWQKKFWRDRWQSRSE